MLISELETNYIKSILRHDYSTYCGRILKKFYYEFFSKTGSYNRIGSYWEKGHKNEIDLVAINDIDKKIVIAKIKMNKKKINIEKSKYKSTNLLKEYRSFKTEWLSLDLESCGKYLYVDSG